MPQVFGEIKDITLMGYVIRTILVGVIVFLVGRFVTKRSFSQMTTFDFALIWILGALTVSPLLEGDVTFTRTITPILTLFFWHTALSMISLKSRSFAHFFNGKPLLLIDDGKIVRKHLRKHFMNIDLLLAELRIRKVFDISEVRYCMLEPNGQLSIMKYSTHDPVTASDMKTAVSPVDIPLVVINDGKLFEENLKTADVDLMWLKENLKTHQVDCIEAVYLATVDQDKKLYVSKK
ncbi:YetF domain-containing protein [Fictibacillus phosphorivorans]|uniref:YetF domain-containing protein n=1 Tax=Fictibacillus phosphorivorans TaxID=1221500 RepID=UPI001292D550|nr:DUF421 domain-containing protein [Fictibacillus phosphorivorans]MQR95935.1 DUF421 domain-containing protein [Fictibacillus phosphorivorans]